MVKKYVLTKSRNAFFERFAFVIVLVLDLALLSLLVFSFGNFVIAAVGGNATVTTQLIVGAVAPEILSVSINAGATAIDLTPNATVEVIVQILARDFNGEANLSFGSTFYDMLNAAYTDLDDNNEHYTNNSCFIDTSYGTVYEVNATCRHFVWYYAFNSTWNASVNVTDNTSRTDFDFDTITISSLLALGVPETIDYGIVNQTEVSRERTANVTNFGNVMLNLSLEGYGANRWDNLSMNCTLGTSNISVEYQKYNLTASNSSFLNITTFSPLYINLTSTRVVKTFNLNSRLDDVGAYIDDTNATYWRIYVPVGAAGYCRGNIIFGANLAEGT